MEKNEFLVIFLHKDVRSCIENFKQCWLMKKICCPKIFWLLNKIDAMLLFLISSPFYQFLLHALAFKFLLLWILQQLFWHQIWREIADAGTYKQYLNCKGKGRDASLHRELASPHRDWASPYQDLGVPPSRFERRIIRGKRPAKYGRIAPNSAEKVVQKEKHFNRRRRSFFFFLLFLVFT